MSIYFLRHGSLIKIGYSSSLSKRVGAIISSIPGDVTFIGHMPGDREVEAYFHARFASARFSGEWFAATAELEQLAAILLDPVLPVNAAPTARAWAGRRSDADDAWREASGQFREACGLRWPLANHNERKAAAASVLGWSFRRSRSLYDCQPGCTLRQVESEQLRELLFPALSDAAQQIEASDEPPEPKGDDE